MIENKYIFGPVPSRRLGLSLGIDVIPMKTCSLSCRYCQIGITPLTTVVRREYVTPDVILPELRDYLAKGQRPDFLTFSGSGEPTLNKNLGSIIRGVKSVSNIPVCVITNGTMLWDPQVREDLLDADVVMPSLDSASEETFREICRPHPDLHVEKIVEGMVVFRTMYPGKIWLEVLFVSGFNDSPEELAALRDAVSRIKPDSLQLNTVVRPPADSSAHPVTLERLEEIRAFFGGNTEIIAAFNKKSGKTRDVDTSDVLEYLKRRPGSTEDISESLGAAREQIERILGTLLGEGIIRRAEFFGKCFWEYNGG